jgi:hypothetical protein
VSSASDGPDTGPMAEPVAQTGRPPVPRPVPSDAGASGTSEDAVHRTEAVPFPLPPLPAGDRPAPAPGPATGRLYLADYPPRVPGAVPGTPHQEPPGAPAPGDADADGGDDGR